MDNILDMYAIQYKSLPRSVNNLAILLNDITRINEEVEKCIVIPHSIKQGIESLERKETKSPEQEDHLKYLRTLENHPDIQTANTQKKLYEAPLADLKETLSSEYSCKISMENNHYEDGSTLISTYSVEPVDNPHKKKIVLKIGQAPLLQWAKCNDDYFASVHKVEKESFKTGLEYSAVEGHKREDLMKKLAQDIVDWLDLKIDSDKQD